MKNPSRQKRQKQSTKDFSLTYIFEWENEFMNEFIIPLKAQDKKVINCVTPLYNPFRLWQWSIYKVSGLFILLFAFLDSSTIHLP